MSVEGGDDLELQLPLLIGSCSEDKVLQVMERSFWFLNKYAKEATMAPMPNTATPAAAVLLFMMVLGNSREN